MRGRAMAMVAAMLIGGCATQPAPRVSAVGAPPSAAEQAAALLAEAAASADGRGDTARLGRAIRALDAIGAHPIDPADDALGAWRARAGIGPAFRGRLLGPAYRSGTLDPGETTATEQLFLAGQPASVAVAARGADTLILAVSDDRSASICRPTGSRSPACAWTPVFSARYRISVANRGRRAATYYLVTN